MRDAVRFVDSCKPKAKVTRWAWGHDWEVRVNMSSAGAGEEVGRWRHARWSKNRRGVCAKVCTNDLHKRIVSIKIDNLICIAQCTQSGSVALNERNRQLNLNKLQCILQGIYVGKWAWQQQKKATGLQQFNWFRNRIATKLITLGSHRVVVLPNNVTIAK